MSNAKYLMLAFVALIPLAALAWTQLQIRKNLQSGKTMEYVVIETNDLSALTEEVNSRISCGWILQGGVSCSYSEDAEWRNLKYCQAMTRESL